MTAKTQFAFSADGVTVSRDNLAWMLRTWKSGKRSLKKLANGWRFEGNPYVGSGHFDIETTDSI